MRRVWMSAVCALCVACGSRHGGQQAEGAEQTPPATPDPTAEAETPQEPEAPPEPTPEERALAELRARAEQVPFRWFDEAPENGVPSEMGAIGATRRFQASVDDVLHTYEVTGEGVVTCRAGTEETWRVQIPDPFTGLPVIGGMRDAESGEALVLVAAPIQDAWMLEMLRASDGTQRWHATGGIRSIGVELGVVDGLVALYAREDLQDETFVLRPADGVTLARIPAHPQASRWDRHPPPDDAARSARTVPAPTRVACTPGAQAGQSECTLQREGIEGALHWTSEVPSSCRALAVGGEGDDVVVAELCDGATGVRVLGGSIAHGEPAFSTRPFGIGPIAHSRWSNAVLLSVEPRWIRLWGTESGLHYVTTLDRQTGRELATTTARPAHP